MKPVARWALAFVAAAGLGIDAFVHLDIAHFYAANTTGTVNEAVLFQIEGALAIAAALWILARPGAWSAGFALLVAGGGAAVLLLYRYVDVGKLGPVPDMYDPEWFPKKDWTLAGELAAALAAAVLLLGTLLVGRLSFRRELVARGHPAPR
jgi:hypothetical protein